MPISKSFDALTSIHLAIETLEPIKHFVYSVLELEGDATKCFYEEYSPESFADILLSLDKSLLETTNKSDIINQFVSSSYFDSAARNQRKYCIELDSLVKESVQKLGGMMDYAYYYDWIQQALKCIALLRFFLYPMNYYCKYIKRGNLEVTNTLSDWEKVIWIFYSILHTIGVTAFYA